MALLGAVLLLELACMVTLAYCRAWGYLAIVAALVLLQLAFNLWALQVRQQGKYTDLLESELRRGCSHEEALMAANYEYPDARVFARLAKDYFTSLFERKG